MAKVCAKRLPFSAIPKTNEKDKLVSKTKAKHDQGSLVSLATGITDEGKIAIATAMNSVIANLFALYVKTKNFHWHMTGVHFRDHHLLLDDQGAQVLATIDPAAERVRKLGQSTLRSLGHIVRLQSIADSDAEKVTQRKCLLNCVRITAWSSAPYAAFMMFATERGMWPRQALSRTGSTRLKDGSGSSQMRLGTTRFIADWARSQRSTF